MELDEFNLKLNTLNEKEERLLEDMRNVQNERDVFYKTAVKDGFVWDSSDKTWRKG